MYGPANTTYLTYSLQIEAGTTIQPFDKLRITYAPGRIDPRTWGIDGGVATLRQYNPYEIKPPRTELPLESLFYGIGGVNYVGDNPTSFLIRELPIGTPPPFTARTSADWGYVLNAFIGGQSTGVGEPAMRPFIQPLSVSLERNGLTIYTSPVLGFDGQPLGGIFAKPEPGLGIPLPTEVPGKEYSNRIDQDSTGAQVSSQTLLWDGYGNVRNGLHYAGAGEVDEMANKTDALFGALLEHQATLLFSTTGDDPAPILYANPTGSHGVWATEQQINAAGVTELDALEVWGPEETPNADRYSLVGDPGGIAVFDESSAGTPAFTVAELASAIGLDPSLWDKFDLDGLMTHGDEILFSIAPVGQFDGGEIWYCPRGEDSARFLEVGPYRFDTDLDIRGTFGTTSENIDALEAVAKRLEPISVPEGGSFYSLISMLGIFTFHRYDRRRTRLSSGAHRAV